MNGNVFFNIYEKGLYSDIELTINGKLYKLHKFFISKSKFFKALIDNIGKMSTNEEINILDITGKMIRSKYIDDVLRWIYANGELVVKILIDPKSNFEVVLQYYYIIDFLQIGDVKKEIIKILDNKLVQCNPRDTFVPIRKVTNTYYTYYCNSKTYNVSENKASEILGYIYGNLMKMKRFFSIIKNKKPGRNISDAAIYDQYINYICEEKINEFIYVKFRNNSSIIEENNEVVTCMYYAHKFIIQECLPHMYYIPQSDSKLNLEQVKMSLDIVDIKNRAKLIELLDIDDWHCNGALLWENIREVSGLCSEYDLMEEYKNKLKAFMYVYL